MAGFKSARPTCTTNGDWIDSQTLIRLLSPIPGNVPLRRKLIDVRRLDESLYQSPDTVPAPPAPSKPAGPTYPPFSPTLVPDLNKLIWKETNVFIHAGVRTNAAYDLYFYPQLGQPTRGVLLVKFIMSFKFVNGKSKQTGATLVWSSTEKRDYMQNFKNLCESVWSEQHRLLTAGTLLQPITDAGVVVNIQARESISFLEHSHWNAIVNKVDKVGDFRDFTCPTCGGTFTNDEVDLNSQDLIPTPGLVGNIASVHEVGHMLGYRDEYPEASDPNGNWLADKKSIMNNGLEVRDRFYAFFADWLSNQWAEKGSQRSRSIWKVNGTLDVSNALL